MAERNAETAEALAADPGFGPLKERLREVLDASDRIPYTTRRGAHLYNFWQDAEHVRGLRRRTPLEQYRKDEPEWEVLLDVDALAAGEDEKWVWDGATVRRPDHDRALVRLSRDGADAAVVREFDLEAKEFVADGFRVPEAKTQIGWIDADTVFVGTDTGPGSLTESGYPRTVRRWRRGTPLETAATVFEAEAADVSAWGYHDDTPGFERDFVGRSLDFFRGETYLLEPDGTPVRIDVPDDASAYAHRRHLIVTPRSAWLGQPSGSLLAFDFDAFLAGDRTFEVLFTPDERTALAGHTWTRHHLILQTMRDVSTRIEVLTPTGAGPWERAPSSGSRPLRGRRHRHGPGPLRRVLPRRVRVPPALHPPPGRDRRRHRGPQAGPGPLRRDRPDRRPALRDLPGRHARAVLRHRPRPRRHRPRPHPALRLRRLRGLPHPSYGAVRGRAWLERGGTHVVANIRGGGEYGPDWHQAALGAARPRAFEDFAAVAEDLVARGVTTPDRLGAVGGSNGGLLMGAMLTRYPELFGAIVAQVPLLDMTRFHRLSRARPGSPSTATRTTRPTCRTCGTSPRTTAWRRTGPTRPSS